MENLLLVLVFALLLGLLAAIGAMLWLGHRFLKLKELQQTQETSEEKSGPSVPKIISRNAAGADILKALRGQGHGLYCVDHSDMIAVGLCSISGEAYCEHCLTSQKDVKVAKKYLDLYLDSEWVEVVMLHNQEISQDAAERIVKVKKSLWSEQGRPMIVQGHYKINVQSDEIEAFTVVIARKDDAEFIRGELSFIQ